MGKQFTSIKFDPKRCRLEIDEFGTLLRSKPDLSERNDIQPFFKAREQLSAFVGTYMRNIGAATDIVFEYPFYGDFTADMIVGDKAHRRFCVVEFEDGGQDSIFKAPPSRTTTEWSQKFNHGFSQIVDWFSMIDDLKKRNDSKEISGTIIFDSQDC